MAILCAECTPWAAAKGWASFSILMCQKPEHGKTRPCPGDARKMFEKYLGKLNTAIIDTSIILAVNFNYQIYSLAQSEMINPPSFITLTFDSELGIEIDTSTVTVIPEIPEHLFYLMQWFRIRGANHLIFFDRAANAHLFRGKWLWLLDLKSRHLVLHC